jgi:hypothetical protein
MASCPAVAYRNRARLMNGLSVGLAWRRAETGPNHDPPACRELLTGCGLVLGQDQLPAGQTTGPTPCLAGAVWPLIRARDDNCSRQNAV